MANELQHENSPYLQQHAHNPVDWMPWGDKALQKAKDENKLIIVSIGYSACHWCHVMERESFENDAIAKTMNSFYVPIKIDREERPDIDQIYMIAVQLMTNAGGWPLNCICLPDGRPIYGGTYFKPQDWQQVLLQVAQMWEQTPEIAIDYAERLTQGVVDAEKLPISPIPSRYTLSDLQEIVQPWVAQFDTNDGGYTRAPKFPLPNNWMFLLRYAALTKDESILSHVHFTLDKIASGGIYDHVGGGFARYAVDGQWHIPHFEKMLYDNGQLISLYCEAFQHKQSATYKQVVEETIEWARREMLDANGGFYAALDADSEGIEGKYYIFDLQEIRSVLGDDATLAAAYYNITEEGNWPEEHTNVLKTGTDSFDLIQQAGFSEQEWRLYLDEIKSKLFTYRAQRIRPGLDHKQLTSWNALMLKGLIDAYRTFDKPEYLELATQTLAFINKHCYSGDQLLHQPADKNRIIPGFLDDYALTAEALIALYSATFDESYLEQANTLTRNAINHFYEASEKTFYYTAQNDQSLIARKSEIMDNVIPSSSSTFVRVLYVLSELFDNSYYLELADQVFANVFPYIKKYGSAYSNWATQLLEHVYGNNQIAFVGNSSLKWRKELDKYYIPNKTVLGGTKSSLPLLKDKGGLDSKAYLCRNKTCSLPQNSVLGILQLLNDNRD
ncbi:MAG: thioredoxin domain-containing protein [Sphingobacterium sp.]